MSGTSKVAGSPRPPRSEGTRRAGPAPGAGGLSTCRPHAGSRSREEEVGEGRGKGRAACPSEEREHPAWARHTVLPRRAPEVPAAGLFHKRGKRNGSGRGPELLGSPQRLTPQWLDPGLLPSREESYVGICYERFQQRPRSSYTGGGGSQGAPQKGAGLAESCLGTAWASGPR